jgi:hypothetical protein
MPFYHKLGTFPHKRHTVFRNSNTRLCHEHLMGNLACVICGPIACRPAETARSREGRPCCITATQRS